MEDKTNQAKCIENTLNEIVELYKDKLPIDMHIKVKCVCTNDYDSDDNAAELGTLNYCDPNDIIILYSPKGKPYEYRMLHVCEINGLKCTRYIESSNSISALIICVSEEIEKILSKYKRASSVLKDQSITLSERDEIYKDLRENYIKLGRDLPEGYNGK